MTCGSPGDWDADPEGSIACQRARPVPVESPRNNRWWISLPCRTLSGFEPGATLHFSAVMEYRQSGEVIDRCERVVARRSPGRFRPGCYLREPLRIPLPIVVSGTGEGVSSPVRVPGGRLIAQLSLSTGSAFVTAIYEDGSTKDIFW